MAEQFDTPDPEFMKGFNEGYTIAKQLPDLSKQLGEINSETLRSQGFQLGREQYITEQKKERYPAWLNSDRFNDSRSDPDHRKGRDKEPER